jgi:hypothetical protein
MDPFVRRLVERLFEPGQPLSRNRHFHTFENSEGKKALRIRRRLVSLQDALATCRRDGGAVRLERTVDDQGLESVALQLKGPNGTRTTYLEADEFELLQRLPGVTESLAGAR